jgi:hypothetical protein
MYSIIWICNGEPHKNTFFTLILLFSLKYLFSFINGGTLQNHITFSQICISPLDHHLSPECRSSSLELVINFNLKSIPESNLWRNMASNLLKL